MLPRGRSSATVGGGSSGTGALLPLPYGGIGGTPLPPPHGGVGGMLLHLLHGGVGSGGVTLPPSSTLPSSSTLLLYSAWLLPVFAVDPWSQSLRLQFGRAPFHVMASPADEFAALKLWITGHRRYGIPSRYPLASRVLAFGAAACVSASLYLGPHAGALQPPVQPPSVPPTSSAASGLGGCEACCCW